MSQQKELDVMKRDRFELLSAYLDGEVSPDERRLVLTWLSEDPAVQCLYNRLLHLRQGCESLRQATLEIDTGECVAPAVIQRLNQRLRLTCMAGLTAAAVAFIGTVSGSLNHQIGFLELVSTAGSVPDGELINTGSLELSIDEPPISIPKPATAAGSFSGDGHHQSDLPLIDN